MPMPNKLKWFPVSSTNLRAIAYYKPRKWLLVEFHNGSIYLYPEFPHELFKEFLVANLLAKCDFSWGRYFHRFILEAGWAKTGCIVQDPVPTTSIDVPLRKMLEDSLRELKEKI